MDDIRYMISEASKRVDVEDHVLRYWERELELPIARNEMGHRYYKESDIQLFIKIKQLKEQGFQLKAIKMMLPNIHRSDSLDIQTMTSLKDELDGKVIDMWMDEKPQEIESESCNNQNEIDIQNSFEGTLESNAEDTIENRNDIGTNKIEISNDEISEENGTSLIINEEQNEIEEQSMDKMEQFKSIMNDIILSALKENNAELTEEIGANVTEDVIKEMKFLLRLQEEKQEERFRKLDTTIRDYQKSRMLAAAGLEIKSRKKSKFFKKNNRAYI